MRRALNALLVVLPALVVGLIVALAFTQPAHAQRNVMVVADSVRATLVRDWDKQSKNPLQVERAYCATYRSIPFGEGTAFYVVGLAEPLHTDSARTGSIQFYCEAGPGHAALHIHPPTTCENEKNCKFGGAEAYECFASDFDQAALDDSHDELGLIQCDRHAVIAFWPSKRTKS